MYVDGIWGRGLRDSTPDGEEPLSPDWDTWARTPHLRR